MPCVCASVWYTFHVTESVLLAVGVAPAVPVSAWVLRLCLMLGSTLAPDCEDSLVRSGMVLKLALISYSIQTSC